jgi:polysaccharide pyruvyl transferase WcaK-like protein
LARNISLPATDELWSPSATGVAVERYRKPKIAFFGIFGIQNLGNECTLQAILHHARTRLPNADIYGICYNPDDMLRRHNLKAVRISLQDFSWIARRTGGLSKVIRILRRIPGELRDWVHAVSTLRGTDVIYMTGTGMLTDYMTTFSGFPYDVFRWTTAARAAGCKVRFVGVGVGPIYGRLSRFLITRALSLANYRSFRDEFSKNRIKKNGFDGSKDLVFPDLAFSLPREIFPSIATSSRNRRRVGIGVMDHRDIHMWSSSEHEAQYSRYLDIMCDFVCWLLKRNYTVRILQGDARHDPSTRADLKARLEQRGIVYDQSGITDEPSGSVEQLISQIADVDVVVSPRFHNLLLGLMLNIPAISISYDPKSDALLEGVGLGKYCQPLPELRLETLVGQFEDLESRISEVKPLIEGKAQEYRAALEKQYGLIFGEFESQASNAGRETSIHSVVRT